MTSETKLTIKKAQFSEVWLWWCPQTNCTALTAECHGSGRSWEDARDAANNHLVAYHPAKHMCHDTTVPIPLWKTADVIKGGRL